MKTKLGAVENFVLLLFNYYTFEPQRQKTHLRVCAPSEDSDQTAHSRSLIRIFNGPILAKEATFLHADNEDYEQTVRTRRLIWVFVGRTFQKVRFLKFRITCL